MDKRMKKTMANLMAKVFYKAAEKNANSVCVFLHGQPQMPDKVKKLNKVK